MVRLGSAVVVVRALFLPSAFGQSAATDAQYAIYSAFLRAQLSGKHGIDDLRVGEKGSVISPMIEPFRQKLSEKRLADIKVQLPEVEVETLDSLASCTTNSYRLRKKLDLPVEYNLMLPEHVKGRYGYINFSCVGTNRSGSQAVFYVSRLKCDCAVEKLVLMRKVQDGWMVVKEIVQWIA